MMYKMTKDTKLTKSEICKIVAEACCEGIEIPVGDFLTTEDGKTEIEVESIMQQRILRKEGFK